jgi:hypothetical protein
MQIEMRWKEIDVIEPSFSGRVACNANCVLIADIGIVHIIQIPKKETNESENVSIIEE